jgi:hypothetical protein
MSVFLQIALLISKILFLSIIPLFAKIRKPSVLCHRRSHFTFNI